MIFHVEYMTINLFEIIKHSIKGGNYIAYYIVMNDIEHLVVSLLDVSQL